MGSCESSAGLLDIDQLRPRPFNSLSRQCECHDTDRKVGDDSVLCTLKTQLIIFHYRYVKTLNICTLVL